MLSISKKSLQKKPGFQEVADDSRNFVAKITDEVETYNNNNIISISTWCWNHCNQYNCRFTNTLILTVDLTWKKCFN